MNANTLAALITRTKTGEDDYGNDEFGEAVQTVPAIWWPDSSSEATDNREQVSWQTTLCLPTGTTVTAVDAVIPQATVQDAYGAGVYGAGMFGVGQVSVTGDRYEIDGRPAAYPPNPHSGWQHPFSVVLTLKRVTG